MKPLTPTDNVIRFKDRSMQRMYESCRAHGQDRSSSFWIEGRPHRGAGHRAAYHNGREGLRPSWPRNTLAYAAWAAGCDDANGR